MSYVFVSDYDGTLYIDEEVTETVLESIHDFKKQGNHFGICTGRNIHSIQKEIDKFQIPVDFVIGNNGGVVLNGKGEEIFTSTITTEIAEAMTEILEEYDIIFYGVSDGYHLARIYREGEEVTRAEDPEEFKVILKNGPCGFYMKMAEEKDAIHLANRINELYADYDIVAFANDDYVDIGKKGVDKATGIQTIVDYYKWNDEVVAIGDSYNDIPMLREFYSFGMSHGVEAIRKHANHLVDTVADAIKHVNMQK
ncbi:HAD-IIB family hydrolase [Erysipelothrix sp. HDW6A]|uniref:HAD family hydrolase n=1 Tax=Erysipelothrix sp. HDW6A TaxID=2714928 RepID=UPI00140DF636|nr:HAD-IIB family hydrolase [Erysipelothrix sp. HDW6A]QIK57961.1 HAD-IIB family hydrolase [Erysipelothrix sp. HDW6A]